MHNWVAGKTTAAKSKKAENNEKLKGASSPNAKMLMSDSEKSPMNSYVPDNTHYNHAQRWANTNVTLHFNISAVRIRLDRNTKANAQILAHCENKGGAGDEKKIFKNGHANGSNNHHNSHHQQHQNQQQQQQHHQHGHPTPDRVYIIKKYRMKD